MMNTDGLISYRRAKNADSEIIKAILFEAFQEYKIDLPKNYSFSDIEDIKQTYLKSKGEFIVLTKDGHIIGFIGLSPIVDNLIELKRLYLKSSHRRRGYGTRLLTLAIGHARRMGYQLMQLETTSKFKEAVLLYKKHGFTENINAEKSPGHDLALQKWI